MSNVLDYDLYNGPVDPKEIKSYRLEETTRGTANWAVTRESPFLDVVIKGVEYARDCRDRDWRVSVCFDGAPDTWAVVLTPHFTDHGLFPGVGAYPSGLLPRSFGERAVAEAEKFVLTKMAPGDVSEGDLYAAVAPLWVSTVAAAVDEMIAKGLIERDGDGYLS